MKKEVTQVLRTYSDVLTDIRDYVTLSYPEDQKIIDQMIAGTTKFLKNVIETRGLRVVYQDFPSLCVSVDRSLSDGYVNLPMLRKTLGSYPKSSYPKAFSYLFAKVYDEDGLVLEDPDITCIFFIRQVLMMFKKIVRDCSPEATVQSFEKFAMIEDYIASHMRGTFPIWEDPLCENTYSLYPGMDNNSLETQYERIKMKVFYNLHTFDGDFLEKINTHHTDVQRSCFYLTRVFRYVSVLLGEPTIQSLVPRHGSGAVSDMPWGDKYTFPTWTDKLETMFPMADFAILNYQDYDTLDNVEWFLDDPVPVEIIAVPKTLKGPRIIGTETVSRMFCQQALLQWLKPKVTSITSGSVTIDDQTRSQRLSLEGSKTGAYATIDLSSASDWLSCELVEEVFANNPTLLRYLSASRATYWTIKDPHYVAKNGDEVRRLHKFSHQGSAVTFPVQSIAYYCIAVAAVLCTRMMDANPSNIRKVSQDICVYGDDIIVPTEAYGITCDLLAAFGLRVNVDKSHGTGFFRESCGVDAYKGIDVTPVYLRDLDYDVQKPETVVRFVEVSNNLHKAGLWNTSNGSFDCSELNIPITNSRQVPLAMFTFCDGFDARHLKTRLLVDGQHYECRQLVPFTKGDKHVRDGYASILQYCLESPSPNEDWAAGFYAKRPKVATRMKWTAVPGVPLNGNYQGFWYSHVSSIIPFLWFKSQRA